MSKHLIGKIRISEKERDELLGINNRIFSGDTLKKFWIRDLSAEDDFRAHEIIGNLRGFDFEPETNDNGHIVCYTVESFVPGDLRELALIIERNLKGVNL